MPNDPLDLWPESIEVDQLTPLAILQMQAARLKEKTRGLLTAEVRSGVVSFSFEEHERSPSGSETVHRFEIIAQRLKGYRYQMFTCRHDSVQVYPVWIEGEDERFVADKDLASTQDQFVQIVRKVLAATKNVGIVSSLLARIAEADVPKKPPTENETAA